MAPKHLPKSDIQELAERVASELLRVTPSLRTATPGRRQMAILQTLDENRDDTAKLRDSFNKDASFGDLRDGWLRQANGAGGGVGTRTILLRLINSVIEGHPAEIFLAEARAFGTSGMCTTEYYIPLCGATVTKRINLGASLEMVPWDDVPDSDSKAIFSPGPSRIALWATPSANATSALRYRYRRCRALFSSHAEANTSAKILSPHQNDLHDRIQDVVRCVAVLSEIPVAAIGSWSQFDREFVRNIGISWQSINPALSEAAIWAASSHPVQIEEETVTKLVRRFERFKTTEKAVMRVALDRLNQATRRSGSVDKAIDLGIALEVMLLHEINEGDRGELRFRTAIRGATFLNGPKSKRLETFDLLKNAYDLRSKAVHSGVLKETRKKGTPAEQILKDATNACTSIARKIITRGSFPNWDADYVIGGRRT